MENYSIVLILLLAMIGLMAWSEKMKIAYPIVLIIGGIMIGFMPRMPRIEINPEIIFLIFLPPLLYDAAFNISLRGFRNNFNTISALATSLVFITAAGIAAFAHYYIPGMTWSLSFVLGSTLAATDAVAATSITKKLGLSHNTVSILEGESLVNDASALVAYNFSMAAVIGVSFAFWRASLSFLCIMAGGILVGLVMGRALAFVLMTVKNQRLVVLSFMVVTPFITYLIAEDIHVSGVIAVVVLGLGVIGLSNRKFPEEIKRQSKTIWDLIVFLLNGLIFLLIGLEFSALVREIDSVNLFLYSGYAFFINLIALLIRMLRIFFHRKGIEFSFNRKKIAIEKAKNRKSKQRPLPRYYSRIFSGARRRNVFSSSYSSLISFPESVIISWSGMRGIVSLAIALAIPKTLNNGDPFPMRDAIIFISILVVLFSIVGQGLLLPLVVRRMKKNE